MELTTVHRYLDGLSYENVNDVEVRATLRAARGFCAHHAWQFLDVTHDSLGAAIIYRDVLGTILAELGPLAGRHSFRQFLRRFTRASLPLDQVIGSTTERIRPRMPCPACQALGIAVAERGHSRTYLCLPHCRVAAASGRLNSADLREVRAATIRRLERLVSKAESPGRRRQSRWNPQERRGSQFDLAEVAFGKRGIARVLGKLQAAVAEPISSVSAPPHALGPTADGHTCLVCTLVARDVTEALAAHGQTLSERLAALIEADDLCNVHAWRALDAAGGEAEARRYPMSPDDVDRLARKIRLATPTSQCRACVLQDRREADYCVELGNLVDATATDQPRPQLGPICLPHLLRAFSLVPGDRVLSLVHVHVGALRQLRQELAEYIRKHDYRFRNESAGTEQTAPARALALVVGARSLG